MVVLRRPDKTLGARLGNIHLLFIAGLPGQTRHWAARLGQDTLTHLRLPDRATVPPLFWLVFSGPRVIGQGSCAQSFTDVLPSMPCVPGSGSCANFPHLASLTPVRSMVARPGKLHSSPLAGLYWPGLTLGCQAGKIYHHSQRWPSQDRQGLRVAGRGRYGFSFMAGLPGLAKTCVASLGKMCPLFNDFPSQDLAKWSGALVAA